MRNYLFFIFYFIAVFIFSCQPQKDKRSRALDQYLIEKHQNKIPDSTHFFVVLSEAACSGCVNKTMNWAQKDSLSSNVTCINLIQMDTSSFVQLDGGSQILTGDFLDASQYDFYSGGVAIFRTYQGKIDTVIYPTFQNIREVLSVHGILRKGI